MATLTRLEKTDRFDDEAMGGIGEEVPQAKLSEFLKESFNEIFLNDETAMLLFVKGRPCFWFIQRRFLNEC